MPIQPFGRDDDGAAESRVADPLSFFHQDPPRCRWITIDTGNRSRHIHTGFEDALVKNGITGNDKNRALENPSDINQIGRAQRLCRNRFDVVVT